MGEEDWGALSRVFLDFSRPFYVRKKLGKIEGNRDKSRINWGKLGTILTVPDLPRTFYKVGMAISTYPEVSG